VHTPEEKAAALKDRETLGTEAAAVLHQVSAQAIRNWLHEAKAAAKGAVGESEASPVDTPADRPAPDPDELRHRREAVARRYTPTEIGEAVETAAALGVAAAVRQSGASAHTVYRWRDAAAKAAGEPVERKWEQTELEKQRDLEILHEWHKQPGLGPSQICNQLRRRGIHTAVGTVRQVMVDHGYRPPKVQSQAHHERYEAVRPNALWHLDFLHRHIHQAPTFTLILLDDFSRFVVGHAVDDAERADTVLETFEAAVARHGKPEAVMSDKGSAFWAWRGISRFTALLTELSVEHVVAADKTLNGKVEKFNADLAKELFNVQTFGDVAEMRRALAAHLHGHNHVRTHHALGGVLVPADRYYAESSVMRSAAPLDTYHWRRSEENAPHNQRGVSEAISSSRGRKRPRRKVGGVMASMASSLSVGSMSR
jgi:transposase InsO family protein